MAIQINTHTIEDLITAFSYKLSMDRSFYWKRETNHLVEVSMFDYALVSECKENYESGLDANEERDVKEAIIAIEKNRNTHILIPRLSVNERIELMKDFILSQKIEIYKITLQNTLDELIILSQGKPRDLMKKGYAFGFELDNLTFNSKELSEEWIKFYRESIKQKVYAWLEINTGK